MIFDLIPIKFIVTPLISYLVVCQLIQDPVLRQTVFLLSLMPTAINAVVTARLYGLNIHITAAAFILTTVAFLVAVYPLFIVWLSYSPVQY